MKTETNLIKLFGQIKFVCFSKNGKTLNSLRSNHMLTRSSVCVCVCWVVPFVRGLRWRAKVWSRHLKHYLSTSIKDVRTTFFSVGLGSVAIGRWVRQTQPTTKNHKDRGNEKPTRARPRRGRREKEITETDVNGKCKHTFKAPVDPVHVQATAFKPSSRQIRCCKANDKSNLINFGQDMHVWVNFRTACLISLAQNQNKKHKKKKRNMKQRQDKRRIENERKEKVNVEAYWD